MPNNDEQKYYLALDWGRARVGLALADEETKLATAYSDVAKENLLTEIEGLSRQMSFKKVIIGFISQPGDYSLHQKEIIDFAQQLQAKGFSIDFEKEDFSTKLAQANLLSAGKKNVSKNDNAEAARIILQSWLDRQ